MAHVFSIDPWMVSEKPSLESGPLARSLKEADAPERASAVRQDLRSSVLDNQPRAD